MGSRSSADRCAWPRCRHRLAAGEGVNYLGRPLCDRHWEALCRLPLAEAREKLGLTPTRQAAGLEAPPGTAAQRERAGRAEACAEGALWEG